MLEWIAIEGMFFLDMLSIAEICTFSRTAVPFAHRPAIRSIFLRIPAASSHASPLKLFRNLLLYHLLLPIKFLLISARIL